MTANNRLYAGIAAAVLLAGAGGFAIARMTSADSPAVVATPMAQVEEAGEHGAEEHGDVLDLTDDRIRAAGIAVETVRAGGLAAEILAPATVTAPPGGQAVLTARAAGTVTRIAKRLGDPVRAGEVLAVVESRDAAQIAADRSAAQARVGLAERNLVRERSLFNAGVSPRADLEAAEAEAAGAAAEARRTRAAAAAAGLSGDGRSVSVVSPIAGQVAGISASLGAYVEPATELFRVADPRRVQVEAAVSGPDAARLRAGDRAILELPDGKTIPARVRSVTASLGVETRAATAILEAQGGTLRLGQTLRARIFPAVAAGSTVIVVPEEAVQSVEGRDAVFVRTADGFKATPVTTGRRSAGRLEIVDGLASGTSVATTNAFVLKAELGKGEGEEH